MATLGLKRSDILRKHASRGRPPKPEKERQLKQRAAYQWRDARRVYLAASFERWRKLRSRLQMRDASLAWHLLETHDKDCSSCCRSKEGKEGSSLTVDKSELKDAAKFYPELIRILRQLCHKHLQFEEVVEIVGLICVEMDHKDKVTHSIKEMVQRGLLPKQRTYERQQSDLEATEADNVAAALSRCQNSEDKKGLDSQVTQHLANALNKNSRHTEEDASSLQSGSQASSSGVSHHTLHEQNQLTNTWDGGGVKTVTQSTSALSVLSKQGSEANDRGQSVTPDDCFPQTSVSLHSASAHASQSALNPPYASYDETDHSGQSSGLLQTEAEGAGISGNKAVHSLPGSWYAQGHEQFVSCNVGEAHKVVVSDDGMVSHVVHNGPASGQVYRIDLSNASPHHSGHDTNDSFTAAGGAMQGEGDKEGILRDRTASIESSDSFMEVGLVSKIKHAQRLLASPSPTSDPDLDNTQSPLPHPATLPVAQAFSVTDQLHAPHPTSLESSPSSSVIPGCVASATPPVPAVVPLSQQPSQSSHTSVIKEVFHLSKSSTNTVIKSESSALSSGRPTSGEATSAVSKDSTEEGDLPLDMSLVKDEVEDVVDEVDEFAMESESVSKSKTKASHQSYQSNDGSHDYTTASEESASRSEEAMSGETALATSSASSMQLLQHYTDRVLQQQLQSDHQSHPVSLHPSSLTALDEDDPTKGRKRKLSDLDERMDGGDMGGRGVPWPRKDMTQKEEYQFLETDPFMDFAEMSRLFPNMQQRTFYRWKRRIKDQFIILEQQPSLTYSQFCHYFPNVKAHVFELWQSLIAKGQRFLGDAGKSSTSLGDLGSLGSGGASVKASGSEGELTSSHKERGSRSHPEDFIAQYIFLQKNLSLDADQFCKVFPEVPQHLFYVWKKQIFSDFLKLQGNPKVTYQEFRKQASVTQDVFSLWKAQLACIGTQTSTPSSLSCASSSSLPPVNLLASHAGGKTIGADLAAWYASYAPLMGQMALPFWSPLNMMSGSSLTSSLSSLRDKANSERERSNSHDATDDPSKALERLSEKDKGVRKNVSSAGLDSSQTLDDVDLMEVRDDKVMDSESPSEVVGGGGGEGMTGYRGRRQSLKPEHYHYLLHPDTPYLSLTLLYPGVSAQRYGRWRRKVSAALALLAREPHCTAEQFALSFPNIPDEILASWRDRVKQGHSRLGMGGMESADDPGSSAVAASSYSLPSSMLNHHPSTLASPAHSPGDSSLDPEAVTTSEDMPHFLMDKGGGEMDGNRTVSNEDNNQSKDVSLSDSPAYFSTRKQFKVNREEFVFLQHYASIDFSTFNAYYPSISVRTFYRWRRQIRDTIDILRLNPELTLAEFQKVVPEVSEDIFKSWQTLIKEESQLHKERSGVSSEENGGEEDTHQSADNVMLSAASSSAQSQQPHHTDSGGHSQGSSHSEAEEKVEGGECCPEQWLVHMNPYLDYTELSRTYPSVSQRTFYRWKQEVRHIMDYMRHRDDVRYEDIASVLPEVSREAFLMWQHLLTIEKMQQGMSESKVDEVSAVQSSENLPDDASISLDGSSTDFLQRVGAGIIARETSSLSGSHTLSDPVEQHLSLLKSSDEDSSPAKARRQTREEFVRVMLNPSMDYTEFARCIGTVSQRTFYRWRAHIREWRAAIRADPHLDYATFSRTARDVPESVFKLWQEWESQVQKAQISVASCDGYETAPLISTPPGSSSSHSSQVVVGGSGLQVSRPASSAVESETVDKGGAFLQVTQLEALCTAYDYYQRHPHLHLEELALRFPAVTMDVFQQWKKGVDMKMEYIRSIPTTNFDDFHSLFPDVKEDIFNIWKARVLSHIPRSDNFLFPQPPPVAAVDSASASSLSSEPSLSASQLAAYSAGSLASSHHSLYPQTAAVYNDAGSEHKDVGGSQYSVHGKTALPSVFHAVGSKKSQSPNLPPAKAQASDNALDADSHRVVQVKLESSPNTPLPSFTETVSNLGRLSAMVHHSLPHSKQSSPEFPSTASSLYPHTSVSISSSLHSALDGSSDGGVSVALAGMGHESVTKTFTASSQDCSSGSPHFSDPLLYPLSAQSRSSEIESAIIAESDTVPTANATTARETKEESATMDSAQHKSQRQRKLQRVEYLFVAQNPDVDVQEFLSHFPKVSLRSFYRWKREIREEQQAMGAGHGVGATT